MHINVKAVFDLKSRKADRERIRQELREKKSVAVVYFVLRLLVVATMIRQAVNRNYENVVLCVFTLVLFLMPSIIEKRLRIEFPDVMEIIILLFIFAGEILGEIGAYFTVFKGWDILLHTVNGFLCAAIGFSLVDMLDRNERFSLSLSPVFMALVAFCFSMTIGVFWEFFECSVDRFFLRDMQKDSVVTAISSVLLDPNGGNAHVIIKDIEDVIVVAGGEQISLGVGGYMDIGLIDTMNDLFANFVGALVFSLIGYFYLKNRGEGKIAKRFIPQVLGMEEDKNEREGS